MAGCQIITKWYWIKLCLDLAPSRRSSWGVISLFIAANCFYTAIIYLIKLFLLEHTRYSSLIRNCYTRTARTEIVKRLTVTRACDCIQDHHKLQARAGRRHYLSPRLNKTAVYWTEEYQKNIRNVSQLSWRRNPAMVKANRSVPRQQRI